MFATRWSVSALKQRAAFNAVALRQSLVLSQTDSKEKKQFCCSAAVRHICNVAPSSRAALRGGCFYWCLKATTLSQRSAVSFRGCQLCSYSCILCILFIFDFSAHVWMKISFSRTGKCASDVSSSYQKQPIRFFPPLLHR